MQRVARYDLFRHSFRFAMNSNSSGKRGRRFTSEGSSSSKRSAALPMMDLKDAIDSAKLKFEAGLTEKSASVSSSTSSPGQPLAVYPATDVEVRRKVSSAPSSPGKSLSVMLPTYASSKRPRLLRESLSPRAGGRKSSLLMPANTHDDHSDHDAKKPKKPKGVSMSEVIRLHQVRDMKVTYSFSILK